MKAINSIRMMKIHTMATSSPSFPKLVRMQAPSLYPQPEAPLQLSQHGAVLPRTSSVFNKSKQITHVQELKEHHSMEQLY